MFLEQLRLYFFIGGMPECVKTYRDTEKLKKVFKIQKGLIEAYRADFSKYAPYSDKQCLNSVLTNTARFTGQQIKYTRLADSFTPPTNKKAFVLSQRPYSELLEQKLVFQPLYTAMNLIDN